MRGDMRRGGGEEWRVVYKIYEKTDYPDMLDELFHFR